MKHSSSKALYNSKLQTGTRDLFRRDFIRNRLIACIFVGDNQPKISPNETLFLLLFLTVFAWIGTAPIHAEEPSESTSTSTRLQRTYTPGHGKRVPTKLFIECILTNNSVIFDANFDYEYMTVEIISDSTSREIESVITPFEPYVIIPGLSGECIIRCTTDTGVLYEGILIL